MKFGQAIDSVLFKNYFNLEGKATRSEYWWFMLFFIIFYLFAGVILAIAVPLAGLTDTALDYFLLGTTAVFFLPILGLSVRRFADAGRGRREAILFFALAFISSLIVPMEAQGAIIQVAEFLIIPAWLVFGVTSLYTLYISLKKSV